MRARCPLVGTIRLLLLHALLLCPNKSRFGEKRTEPSDHFALFHTAFLVDELANALAGDDSALADEALAVIASRAEIQLEEVCRSDQV